MQLINASKVTSWVVAFSFLCETDLMSVTLKVCSDVLLHYSESVINEPKMAGAPKVIPHNTLASLLQAWTVPVVSGSSGRVCTTFLNLV